MDLGTAEKEAFVNEANERLQQFNDFLLEFEKSSDDTELLNKLFRIAHTIKGNAGFVSLDNMVHISHAAENLLALLRDKKLQFDTEIAGLLFESYDLNKDILEAFILENNPENIDSEALADKINHLIAVRLDVSVDKKDIANQYEISIKLKENIALPAMRAYLIRKKLVKIHDIACMCLCNWQSPSLSCQWFHSSPGNFIKDLNNFFS